MGLVWWLDWEFMKQNYIRYESAQNGSGIYPVWNKMLNRCVILDCLKASCVFVRHVITVIVLWNRRIKAIKYWYDAHSAFYRLMCISGKSSSLWLLSSFCFLGFGLLQVTGRALPCHESWPPGHHPPLLLQLMDLQLVQRWQTASGPSSAMLRRSAHTQTVLKHKLYHKAQGCSSLRVKPIYAFKLMDPLFFIFKQQRHIAGHFSATPFFVRCNVV